jgi:hypothetical protein
MGNEFNELDLAETIAKLIKNTKEQYPKLKTELKLTQCFGVNSEDGKDSLDDLVLVKPIQNKIINTSSALYPNTNKINMVSSMDKIPKNSVIYQLYSKLKEEYGVEPDKIKGGYGLVMFYTKNDKNRRHAFAYGKNSIILYKNPEDIKQDEKIINLNEDVTCPKDVNIELMKYNNEKTPATFLSSLLTHRSEVYKVDPEPSFLKKLQDALANIAKYFTIG